MNDDNLFDGPWPDNIPCAGYTPTPRRPSRHQRARLATHLWLHQPITGTQAIWGYLIISIPASFLRGIGRGLYDHYTR